jgi:hypothetical protein
VDDFGQGVIESDSVQDYRKNPLSLKRLSANVLRLGLKPNAFVGVKGLALPPGFDQKYITLGYP